MGLLKKVGKAFGKVLGAVFKPIGSLLSALLPKVKIPKSLEQSGSTYNADARVNSSKLGDVKAVLYGEGWVWPAYCSIPFKYFQGHDQYFAVYVHLSVGYVDAPAIFIGDTSATRFPGFQSELCPPGVDMELILPDVYTCPEVEQIELLGGIDTADDDGKITVHVRDTGTTTFTSGLLSGTITGSYAGFWDDFIVYDEITANDAGANDGGFTILGFSDDGQTATVAPSPITGSESEPEFFVSKRWAGPFPACQPGATVETIAIDIIFNALRDEDNDPTFTRSATVKISYRPIDDAGNPIAPGTWTEDDVTYEDNVNRVRRYTSEFTLSGPMRPEVRVWRETYEQNDSGDPSSAAQWVGLKGYIIPKPGDSPASDADSTRLAILVRSSGFLASQSENAIKVFFRRRLPVYESGGWSDPVFTRTPAWAAVDYATDQGAETTIAVADLDVGSFVDSAAAADSNEDTFDAVFDREVGLKEGVDSILRVARSKLIFDPFTRLYKVYRDEPSDPVQLFCDGFNCRAGSDSISLPDADTVTGVYVTFMDPLLWTEREGPTVGTDVDPRKVRGFGFTAWVKAFIEATFQYRDLLYRNHSVSISTEMEGLIPLHGQRILLASAAKGWGHSGEVVAQTGTTLQVWPAPVWDGTGHYVYLQDDDGVPQGPFTCTQGLAADLIELDSDPGLTLRVGAGLRSLYAFGNADDGPRIAIVMERTSDNPRTASLNLLFDHPFVHEDPGPAPEDPYETDGEIPDLTVENLVAEQEITGDILLDPSGVPLADPSGEFLVAPGGDSGGVIVNVSWDAVAGATSYQLRWKYIGIPGWHYATTIDNELIFSPPTNGTIQIRVKALSTTYVGPETTKTVEIDAYP